MASELLISHSLSALRLCCLAFFALLGANRASLSKKASLNFSAMGISGALSVDADGTGALRAAPETAHVLGSMSSTTEWSSEMEAIASVGTCTPRKPMGDAFGLTIIRGHSVASIVPELSSILGCKNGKFKLESHNTFTVTTSYA